MIIKMLSHTFGSSKRVSRNIKVNPDPSFNIMVQTEEGFYSSCHSLSDIEIVRARKRAMSSNRVISEDIKVGIFDTEYKAVIRFNRITVESPYILWNNNSGNLRKEKTVITDSKIISKIHSLADRENINAVWEVLGRFLDDDFLIAHEYFEGGSCYEGSI
jgi:hypothetical protein